MHFKVKRLRGLHRTFYDISVFLAVTNTRYFFTATFHTQIHILLTEFTYRNKLENRVISMQKKKKIIL